MNIVKSKWCEFLSNMNYKVWIKYKDRSKVVRVANSCDGEEHYKYGIIDNKTGEFILPLEYDYIDYFENLERIIVKDNDKYGLFDLNGNQVVPIVFSSIDLVTIKGQKLFLVQKESSKEELINMNGDPVVPTFEDANGQVFFADKISQRGSMLFSKVKVIYTSGYYIGIEDIIKCYYYNRSYSGDGSTDITEKSIEICHGKKKVHSEEYEKYAGPSWDDYADVMESEDKVTCYISTKSDRFDVAFDRDVWKWIEDFFPSE